MSPYKSIITCIFAKYAVFRGRASRSEAGWFNVFLLVAGSLIIWATPGSSADGIFLFFLVLLLPHLASLARRLHDIELSGFFCGVPIILISFPILSFLILMVVLNNPYFVEDCCRVAGFAEYQEFVSNNHNFFLAAGIAVAGLICAWPSQNKTSNSQEVFK